MQRKSGRRRKTVAPAAWCAWGGENRLLRQTEALPVPPKTVDSGGQPFTEPVVILAQTCSWKMANTRMLGITAMVMAANIAV